VGAKAGEATPAGATAGYNDAALLLSVLAVIAALIAALRGQAQLSHDPALTAE
jgi:hypothetical protein